MPPREKRRRGKLEEREVFVYVDFSNFIARLNELLNTRIFQQDDERHIELSRILAKIIHNIFASIPEKLSFYVASYRLIPFRLYCYGSYFGAGRKSYNEFKEEMQRLGNVKLHFIERGRKRREKGIDTRIAVDMLMHTFNEVLELALSSSRKRPLGEIQPRSIAVLVAGDADFAPVVEAIRELRKRVYILFYSYAIPEELKESSDGIIELTVDDIVFPEFATLVINSFADEFLDSINRVINRLESDNAFEPLVREIQTRTLVSNIHASINNADWPTLYDQLKALHDYLISNYFTYRGRIPEKLYSAVIFKLEFYSKIIEKAPVGMSIAYT